MVAHLLYEDNDVEPSVLELIYATTSKLAFEPIAQTQPQTKADRMPSSGSVGDSQI